MSEAEALGGWIALARLGRPRGNRGEITAIGFAGGAERYQCVKIVRLFHPGDPNGRQAEIESAWEHAGRLILKFRGVDSISQAEELSGAEVCIPAADRQTLAAGEVYESNVIGCKVVERATGRDLGLVLALQETGGPALLELESGMLIPFARAICVEIDTAAKRIVVELPEGLEKLNSP